MKIKEVNKVEYFIVETDEKDYNTYRRSVKWDKDSWQVLMWNSWECLYGEDEIEELFQEWLINN